MRTSRAVLPIVELPCSSPTAKNSSFCRSETPASSTSRRNASSCRPLNSGLTANAPLAVRSSRKGGYSWPSICCDLSRPPSIERSMRVRDSEMP
jgi:hypothetical protein